MTRPFRLNFKQRLPHLPHRPASFSRGRLPMSFCNSFRKNSPLGSRSKRMKTCVRSPVGATALTRSTGGQTEFRNAWTMLFLAVLHRSQSVKRKENKPGVSCPARSS